MPSGTGSPWPTPAKAALVGQGEPVPLGKNLRFFGDGYQSSKLIDGRRYWRIPVMDGEFLVEETTDVAATSVVSSTRVTVHHRIRQTAHRSASSSEAVPEESSILRGDGYQSSKLIDGRRYWRIPVMDGEFLVEETTDVVAADGGDDVRRLLDQELTVHHRDPPEWGPSIKFELW